MEPRSNKMPYISEETTIKKYYRTSEVAEACKVSEMTIVYWSNILGMKVGKRNRTRFYTIDQCGTLTRFSVLREVGAIGLFKEILKLEKRIK